MRVCVICLALMAISAVLVPAPSALALSDEEMCKLRDTLLSKPPTKFQELLASKFPCREVYWALFKPKPLKDFMPAEERAALRRTAAAGDCQAAVKLLAKRFVEGHPDAPSILANAADHDAWQAYVAQDDYDDVALCFGLKKITLAQEEIDRRGLAAKPYKGRTMLPRGPLTVEGDPEYYRESAVSQLLNMHLRSYLQHRKLTNPELIKALLKLSYEGKALRFHPQYAYALALWLDSVGELDPVIQAVLDRPIDAKHKARAEEALKTGGLLYLSQFDR